MFIDETAPAVATKIFSVILFLSTGISLIRLIYTYVKKGGLPPFVPEVLKEEDFPDSFTPAQRADLIARSEKYKKGAKWHFILIVSGIALIPVVWGQILWQSDPITWRAITTYVPFVTSLILSHNTIVTGKAGRMVVIGYFFLGQFLLVLAGICIAQTQLYGADAFVFCLVSFILTFIVYLRLRLRYENPGIKF